jgi:hypothetical protein
MRMHTHKMNPDTKSLASDKVYNDVPTRLRGNRAENTREDSARNRDIFQGHSWKMQPCRCTICARKVSSKVLEFVVNDSQITWQSTYINSHFNDYQTYVTRAILTNWSFSHNNYMSHLNISQVSNMFPENIWHNVKNHISPGRNYMMVNIILNQITKCSVQRFY